MKDAAGSCSRSWSIAWICSFVNFLLLGVSRLSGLLYLASIDRYDVDRSRASLPFVLCYTVRNVSGPLIGYIGRKVEIRLLIASGCFLSALGAGACFFAEDITTVTVLWGGVYGLGFGLGTILLPEILNQHFEKYISNANGIAFGGECVAGFVLPVIVELFLDTYGTSGTFLILSGLILHGVPAALLLKSPEAFSRQSRSYKIIETSANEKCATPNCICKEAYDPINNIQSNCKVRNPQSDDIEIINSSKYQSASDLLNGANPLPKNYETLQNTSHISNGYKEYSIFPETVEANLLRSSTDPFHSSPQIENCDIPSSNQTSSDPKPSPFHAFRVFLDPPFILILLTQSSMIFIFTTIMTVIVDFSRDAGVSSHQEVYVLMCLSVSDMLGRFGLGWVTDLKYMSNIAFSSVCYAGTGLMVVGLVFLRGFAMTMLVAFFIGLFLGGLLIVCPGIIMDYIEKDKVTMALASRFVLYAPMSLTQSSLIGFFRGKLGSYSGLFYILGFNCFLCCAFSLLIPCTARLCSRKENHTSEVSETDCQTQTSTS